MSEHDIILFSIPALGSITSLIGIGIFNQLRRLTVAVENLSIRMAVLNERVTHHEKRITHLEITQTPRHK